jgi:hypothetical protein
MKKLYIFLFGLILLSACNSDPRNNLPQTGMFGETFTPDSSVKDVMNFSLTDSSVFAIHSIRGTIEKYCKGEGCWLTLKQGDSYIKVVTKDNSFVLPKNIVGKKAIATGNFVETGSDKGPALQFEATGILISE